MLKLFNPKRRRQAVAPFMTVPEVEEQLAKVQAFLDRVVAVATHTIPQYPVGGSLVACRLSVDVHPKRGMRTKRETQRHTGQPGLWNTPKLGTFDWSVLAVVVNKESREAGWLRLGGMGVAFVRANFEVRPVARPPSQTPPRRVPQSVKLVGDDAASGEAVEVGVSLPADPQECLDAWDKWEWELKRIGHEVLRQVAHPPKKRKGKAS